MQAKRPYICNIFGIERDSPNVFKYYINVASSILNYFERFESELLLAYAQKHKIQIDEIVVLYDEGLRVGEEKAKELIKAKNEIGTDGGKFYLFEIAKTHINNIDVRGDRRFKYYFKVGFCTKHDPYVIRNAGIVNGEYCFVWQKILENHRLFEPLFTPEVEKLENSFFNKSPFIGKNTKVLNLPETMNCEKDLRTTIINLRNILEARGNEIVRGNMNQTTMGHFFRYRDLDVFQKQCDDFIYETTNNMDNGVFQKYRLHYNGLTKDWNFCINALEMQKQLFDLDMSFIPEYNFYNENWFRIVYYELANARDLFSSIVEHKSNSFIQLLISGFKELQERGVKESFIFKLKESDEKDEAGFRDWFSVFFQRHDFLTLPERKKEKGRIDLIVKHDDFGEKKIEFKIWYNPDKKEILNQIYSYLTDFNNEGYIFMINDTKDIIIREYQSIITQNEKNKWNSSWDILNDYGLEYYKSEHKIGANLKTIYHFIFNSTFLN